MSKRKRKMQEISRIETWQAGPGVEGCGIYDYDFRAEVRITDDDGKTKYVQVNNGNDVSSLSVSYLSLHQYDPEDFDNSWTWDTCEECFDSYHLELDDDIDGVLNQLLSEAQDSKYLSLYKKLIVSLEREQLNRIEK